MANTQLYIHIGRAKTGTSAIQQYLHSNRKALQKLGCKYADTGLFWGTHQPLAWALFKEAHEQGNGVYWNHAKNYAQLSLTPAKYWARLRAEVKKCSCPKLVISSEELGVVRDIDATTKLLAEHLDGIDTKIIVYFRRQDDFLQSVYNQAVKGWESRFKGTFWNYVKPILDVGGADCLKVLEPWAKWFGKENIIIRLYEKEQLEGDLFDDFSNCLGLDNWATLTKPTVNVNRSLTPLSLEVLRRVNQVPLSKDEHLDVVEWLQQRSDDAGVYASHSYLTKDVQQALLDTFSDSNRRVAIEYLGREDGVLFKNEADNNESTSVDDIDPSQMLDMVVEIWKHLSGGKA